MIIFKCRFSGDEMLSDAFKPVNVKDADGNEVPGLIEIESIKVNKSGGEVDIGCGNEFGGEGGDEVEDTSEAVNNVIDETIGFDLHEVPMVSIFPKGNGGCFNTRLAWKDPHNKYRMTVSPCRLLTFKRVVFSFFSYL
jgi:inner membrane protein involved in colicin E2 resistance